MFRSIVKNHPLVDGNKRLGLTAVFVFLLVNGYLFWMPRAEAVAFAVDIAEGSLGVEEIARRLRRGSVKIDKLLMMRPAERKRYYGHLAGTRPLIRKAAQMLGAA